MHFYSLLSFGKHIIHFMVYSLIAGSVPHWTVLLKIPFHFNSYQWKDYPVLCYKINNLPLYPAQLGIIGSVWSTKFSHSLAHTPAVCTHTRKNARSHCTPPRWLFFLDSQRSISHNVSPLLASRTVYMSSPIMVSLIFRVTKISMWFSETRRAWEREPERERETRQSTDREIEIDRAKHRLTSCCSLSLWVPPTERH